MHAQDIKMLTVLEPCDGEYRVRVLLQLCGQGVTSFLIGDIRVPAAASYLQFRSLLLFLFFFNLFISATSLSLFLALLSLVVCCDGVPSFAFEVVVLCRSIPAAWERKDGESVEYARGRGRDLLCVELSHSSTSGAGSLIPSGTGMSLTGLI